MKILDYIEEGKISRANMIAFEKHVMRLEDDIKKLESEVVFKKVVQRKFELGDMSFYSDNRMVEFLCSEEEFQLEMNKIIKELHEDNEILRGRNKKLEEFLTKKTRLLEHIFWLVRNTGIFKLKSLKKKMYRREHDMEIKDLK